MSNRLLLNNILKPESARKDEPNEVRRQLFNARYLYSKLNEEFRSWSPRRAQNEEPEIIIGPRKIISYSCHALKDPKPIYVREASHVFGYNIKVAEERFYGSNLSSLLHDAVTEDGLKNLPTLRSSLAVKDAYSKGNVQFNGNNISIQPTVARPRELDPIALSQELYLNQFTHDHWFYLTLLPDFYISHVHNNADPHKGPISWAVDAMEIVHGSLCGHHDYAPIAAEHPYTVLAKYAANLHPKDLASRMDFALDQRQVALVDAIDPNRLSPLAAEFMIRASKYLEPETVQSQAFKNLNDRSDIYVRNGLYADTLLTAFNAWCERGHTVEQSLTASVKIAETLYSSMNGRPWWFRERMDLSVIQDSEILTPEFTQLLLKKGRFNFEHLCTVAANNYDKLEQQNGLESAQIINFMSRVTDWYGIGNTSRANNVIDLAVTLTDQTPDKFRPKALSTFAKYLEHQKPLTTVLGCLEGSETSVSLPGLWQALVQTIPHEVIKELKLDQETLSPKVLAIWKDEIIKPRDPFKRPLLINDSLSASEQTPFLLSAYVEDNQLLLTNGRNLNATPATLKRPFLAYMLFDTRMKSEVPAYQSDTVALKYWHYCANKLPDPFLPPKGFLAAFNAYLQVPDPEYKFTFLEHPKDRSSVSKKNTEVAYQKNAIVSCLLDVVNLGLLDHADVIELMDWVANTVTQDEITTICFDTMRKFQESERTSLQVGWGVQRGCEELIKKLDEELLIHRKVSHRIHLGKQAKDELDPWRIQTTERDIKQIRHSLDNIPKGAEFIERHGHRWERCSIMTTRSRPRNDEDFAMDINSAIGEIQRERQPERVYLLNFISTLVFINSVFQTTGVLTNAEARELTRNQIDLIKSGKISSNPEALPDYRKFGPLVYKLLKTGAVSAQELKTMICDLSDPQNYVNRVCAIYTGVSELKDFLAKFMYKNSFAYPYFKERSFQDVVTNFHDSLTARIEHIERRYGAETAQIVHSLIDPKEINQFLFNQFKSAVVAEVTSMNSLKPNFQNDYREQSETENLAKIGLVHNTLEGAAHGGKVVAKIMNRWARETSFNGNVFTSEGVEELKRRAAEIPARMRSYTANSRLNDEIVRGRVLSFGKLPIGGKIHTHEAMDHQVLEKMNLAGLYSTPFQLIHANQTLNLPATPSAYELVKILKCLEDNNILNWDRPEVQLCLPGRLPDKLVAGFPVSPCALIGAVTMLSSNVMPQYDRDFFTTSHISETGRMAMLYDAGGPITRYYFMGSLPGRIDILGRRAPEDAFLYQLVGSVISQAYDTDSRYRILAPLAADFARDVTDIMSAHGMKQVLEEPWVFEYNNRVRCERHFDNVVTPIMGSYNACVTPEGITGLVSELRERVDILSEEAKKLQIQCLLDPAYSVIRTAMGINVENVKELES